MSCYLRHMHWLFEALDLEYDKPNRTRMDGAIRELLGMPKPTGCPEVWATIKSLSDDDRTGLIPRVGEIISRT